MLNTTELIQLHNNLTKILCCKVGNGQNTLEQRDYFVISTKKQLERFFLLDQMLIFASKTK